MYPVSVLWWVPLYPNKSGMLKPSSAYEKVSLHSSLVTSFNCHFHILPTHRNRNTIGNCCFCLQNFQNQEPINGGLEFKGLGHGLLKGTGRLPSRCLNPWPSVHPFHWPSCLSLRRSALLFKFFVFDCFAFQLETVKSGKDCSLSLSFKHPSCWEI